MLLLKNLDSSSQLVNGATGVVIDFVQASGRQLPKVSNLAVRVMVPCYGPVLRGVLAVCVVSTSDRRIFYHSAFRVFAFGVHETWRPVAG